VFKWKKKREEGEQPGEGMCPSKTHGLKKNHTQQSKKESEQQTHGRICKGIKDQVRRGRTRTKLKNQKCKIPKKRTGDTKKKEKRQ